MVRQDDVDNVYDFYVALKSDDEIDLEELSFVDAIQLDKKQMAEVYYRLQDMDISEISDDMAEFYEFYQERIEGEK